MVPTEERREGGDTHTHTHQDRQPTKQQQGPTPGLRALPVGAQGGAGQTDGRWTLGGADYCNITLIDPGVHTSTRDPGVKRLL